MVRAAVGAHFQRAEESSNVVRRGLVAVDTKVVGTSTSVIDGDSIVAVQRRITVSKVPERGKFTVLDVEIRITSD
jgi:hypothetical protein